MICQERLLKKVCTRAGEYVYQAAAMHSSMRDEELCACPKIRSSRVVTGRRSNDVIVARARRCHRSMTAPCISTLNYGPSLARAASAFASHRPISTLPLFSPHNFSLPPILISSCASRAAAAAASLSHALTALSLSHPNPLNEEQRPC
eukprot:5965739-Pleurochrysis_carterae.AAC.4